MREMLEQKLARFEWLERQMADPAILADSNKVAAIVREHGTLTRFATKYRRFRSVIEQIAQVRTMAESPDPDERELADSELESLVAEREELWNEILELTIGGEDANRNRCVMEIRAGVGGDEAAIFAGDLYRMYKKHGESKGWRVEVMDSSEAELGGFKEIILGFEGDGVFRELQYESGGHRVQRVPETETKGRTHTSLATVAVLPEPEDVEIELSPDDYRKDVFCASGPGGQHVNKTASAVRLTHHETGIVVSMQDEKSQHKNLAKALRILKARLYERKQQEEHKKRSDQRKSQVGSGDRSQRIRTYNWPQNRVTDHRIGFQANLEHVIAGDLRPLTQALLEHDRDQLRQTMGDLD
jgi:peptide chain release factor 1